MNARRRYRKMTNVVMLTLTGLCALSAVGVMMGILGFLVWKGAGALNWDFLTKLPTPVGVPGGGMANAIVGTGKLLLLASLIGLPIGFLSGIYLSEFGSRPAGFVIRYVTDLLNGVPSIVIGIFAYAVVVVPMKSFSTLAGGFALGVMMVPIIVRSTEESLRSVPLGLREASVALGASRSTTIRRVVVPAAFRGILTGMMLALARVAGETAPLLFTAFGNRDWSTGWTNPIASLPVMIYDYAISPFEDWHRQAWAAGLVLLGLVLLTNVAARFLLMGRAAEVER
jgi:phosphate transport system permease protein